MHRIWNVALMTFIAPLNCIGYKDPGTFGSCEHRLSKVSGVANDIMITILGYDHIISEFDRTIWPGPFLNNTESTLFNT